MGWLWSDGSKDSKAGESPSSNPSSSSAPADAASPPTHGSTLPPPPTPPPHTGSAKTKTKGASREEEADAELQKLLEEINYAPSDYSPASERPPVPRAKKGDAKQQRYGLPPPATNSPIDPVALLPTTMSCRSAFDQAYHCQLPGGQLANLYRYGGLRNCKELWSNFWFCMRTNRGYMPPEERARRIQEHYWQREHKYRHGPSSDDVWKMRTDVEREAFQGDWGELDQILKQQQQEQQQRQEQQGKDTPS